MAMNYVVLSSEFGSAARLVGKHLKETAGYAFYNEEDILQKAAQLTEFSADTLHAYDTYLGRLHYDAQEAQTLAREWPEDMPKRVFEAYRKTVLTLVDEGPCLLMERGADIFLRDKVNFLNVFVYTRDITNKLERTMRIGKMGKAEALQTIMEADMQRQLFHDAFSPIHWGDRRSYDLCLNSDEFGIENCAKVVEAIVKAFD